MGAGQEQGRERLGCDAAAAGAAEAGAARPGSASESLSPRFSGAVDATGNASGSQTVVLQLEVVTRAQAVALQVGGVPRPLLERFCPGREAAPHADCLVKRPVRAATSGRPPGAGAGGRFRW